MIRSALRTGFHAGVLAAAIATAPAPAAAATYVLVHGAYQDAMVWAYVAPLLEARGHQVMAIDLPGHGADRTNPARVTFSAYRDRIARAVMAADEPVILVAHGSSGVAISAVAEQMPDRVSALVYVAGYLPADGQSVMALSLADKDRAIGPGNWTTNKTGTLGEVVASDRQAIFCGDCPPVLSQYWIGRFRPEPLAPMATPVRLSAGRFGQVRKLYVLTDRNRAISPAHQSAMAAAGGARVARLDSSHAAPIMRPRALSELLLAQAPGAPQAAPRTTRWW